jgi:hypothetical protein
VRDVMATPFGWYHRDCVNVVQDGAHIDRHGVVRRKDGTTYSIPSCAHPGRVTGGNAPEINHWVEWSSYSPSTAWGKIVASWKVPTAPAASYGVLDDTNQTFFTFPGLETSAQTAIVQPVLTYGNQGTYGGNFWTATSWICSSVCEHSSTVLSVSTGDSLVGTVTASGCSGGNCDWTIVTKDVTTGGTSTLTVEDVASYTYAVGGSMEVYAIQSCPHFPLSGVFLKGISLYDQSNHQATPSWTNNVQSGLSPWCGFSVSSTSTTTNLNDDPGPSVFLSGVTTGNPNQLVTITANPSLGITPYYYSWTVVNGSGSCGNASTCSAHLSSIAGSTTTFELTLYDADSVSAFSEHQVNVCANGAAAVIAASTNGAAQPAGPPPPKC